MPKHTGPRFCSASAAKRTTSKAKSSQSPDAPQPTRATIDAALPQFVGDIQQRPPAHSAIKIAGRRAYKLARAGQGGRNCAAHRHDPSHRRAALRVSGAGARHRMRQRHVRPLARPRPGRRARHGRRDVGTRADGDRRISCRRRGRARRLTPETLAQHLQPALDRRRRLAADRTRATHNSSRSATAGRSPTPVADGIDTAPQHVAEWAAVDPAGQLVAHPVREATRPTLAGDELQLDVRRNVSDPRSNPCSNGLQRFIPSVTSQLANCQISSTKSALDGAGRPHRDGDTSSSHRVKPDAAGLKWPRLAPLAEN